MKHLKLILLAAFALVAQGLRRPFSTANTEGLGGQKRHAVTRSPDSTNFSNFTVQHLLLMAGSDANHVQVCDGAHMPIGSTDDCPAASGDTIQALLFGAIPYTVKLVSQSAVTQGADLYADPVNPGFVVTEPATAGTYYRVGRASYTGLQNADGNYEVEAVVQTPRILVVLAALTSAQVATANATDLTSSEALANALKTQYNALQADMAALVAALNHGGIDIKHL